MPLILAIVFGPSVFGPQLAARSCAKHAATLTARPLEPA